MLGLETNHGLPHSIFTKIVRFYTASSNEADPICDGARWKVFGAYVVVAYVIFLRGSEGFYLDLGGLLRYTDDATPQYPTITFLGKVKGEAHDRCHLSSCLWNKTSPGIDVYHCVSQFSYMIQGRSIHRQKNYRTILKGHHG